VTGSALTKFPRDLIITLAARHKLPPVYPQRFYVTDGGLISYGVDQFDQYRRVAGYVDRILKGDNPADLPVQAPTKYELAINLKTAKALGLNAAFGEMVMAQGLGDEDSQAPRSEEGDRGAGAPAGRDHAPHMGGRHRVPLDQGSCGSMRTVQDQLR
jgi:hypothetical protein